MTKSCRIKPCPFCGGKAKLESGQRAFIGGESTRVALIYCTNCNARSGRLELRDYGKTSHSKEAVEDVINLWNKRVGE